MKVISEQEKQQLLAAGPRGGRAAPDGRQRPPGAPLMPMKDYLQQLEQYARLFPPTPRRPPVGTQWKL